eukprot:jgi/Bigna1/85536/estExt_fgenesh1_pg.C_40318
MRPQVARNKSPLSDFAVARQAGIKFVAKRDAFSQEINRSCQMIISMKLHVASIRFRQFRKRMAATHVRRGLQAIGSALGLALGFRRSNAEEQKHDENFIVYETSKEGTTSLSNFQDMIHDFKRNTCRLVILGETHGDQVAHLLEHRVFQSLSDSRPCILSMEMFETDRQLPLDEYLHGIIPETSMLRDCNVWGNYKKDYRPTVELAKSLGMPVIAANAPSRYVSIVNSLGQEALEKLPEKALELLPPLPIKTPSAALCYKFATYMRATQMQSGTSVDGEGGMCPANDVLNDSNPALKRMVLAQSLWDATMAWKLVEIRSGILRRFHCDLNLGFMSEDGDAFRAIAKTAVFIPVEFAPNGKPLNIDLKDPLLARAADYVIFTNSAATIEP